MIAKPSLSSCEYPFSGADNGRDAWNIGLLEINNSLKISNQKPDKYSINQALG